MQSYRLFRHGTRPYRIRCRRTCPPRRQVIENAFLTEHTHTHDAHSTDNFSQFGGTLPRRTDASVTSGAAHHQSRHSNGTAQPHVLSAHGGGTATTDRRLNGGGGGHHAATKAIFGSCNNLIENSSALHQQQQSGQQQSSGLLTRARSPLGKPTGNSHHNGGNVNGNHGNGFSDGGGVTVQLQPQSHWSHQHNGGGIAVTTSPKSPPKDMDDLIHLPGPLTEDAVMRTLQARFAEGKHFVRIRTHARTHVCSFGCAERFWGFRIVARHCEVCVCVFVCV